MTDSELMATAALLMARTMEAVGDNEIRKVRGEPLNSYGDIGCDLQRDIEKELERRKTAKKEGISMPKTCDDSMLKIQLLGSDLNDVSYPAVDAKCDLPRGHPGNHKASIARIHGEMKDYIARLEWNEGGLLE
jgi:ribosomal protein S3AE